MANNSGTRAVVACHGAAAPGSHRGCVCHDHHVTMDERARIVAIIEDALECDDPDNPCEPHADPCCGPCNWRPVILAAIEGAQTDA